MRPPRVQESLLTRLALRPHCAHSPNHVNRPLLQIRYKQQVTLPPQSHFSERIQRWHRFEDPTENPTKLKVRNPLDYVNHDRIVFRRNQILKRRIFCCFVAIFTLLGVQIFMLVSYYDPDAESQKNQNAERMDGPSKKDPSELTGRDIVIEKPGQPEIKLDENGNELVDTGSGTAPYFPRTFNFPSGDGTTEDQYTLIGLGPRYIRALFAFEVYVVGFYVRTADLNAVQLAFVKHVNSTASSLIPGEKTALRDELMDPEKSYELWNNVLGEVKFKSAVRIVPTRATTFDHMRDGWVRGMANRAQAAAKQGKAVQYGYEGEGFDTNIEKFRKTFGGANNGYLKCEIGSRLVLIRDEMGKVELFYERKWEPKNKKGEDGKDLPPPPREKLDSFADDRIVKQVWMLYLGGKNPSSEDAKKSIVDGVMQLVERPVGTLVSQVT